MSGGDGVFFNRQIVGIATDSRRIRREFLGINFFQVLQKLNICKLGKKLTPANSRFADIAVSFRKGCDVVTTDLSPNANFRARTQFKAESRFLRFFFLKWVSLF